MAVLGIVSSKRGELETEDKLRRIDEAARHCPIEQVGLSPQCGFQAAALQDGAHVTLDQEKRKLELVVRTASRVWP